MLSEFRVVECVTTMDLSHTFNNTVKENELSLRMTQPSYTPYDLENRNRYNAAALVSVLARPNSFSDLRVLRLSGAIIDARYLSVLRDLVSLEELYVDRTGMIDEGMAHLVIRRKSLKVLDISKNRFITDRSFDNLIYLSELEVLHLDETGVTLDGLRKFVRDSYSQNLNQLTIHRDLRSALRRRGELYCIGSQPNMIEDPEITFNMSVYQLRRQLSFHAKINSKILTVGTREQLAKQLHDILERRNQDSHIWTLCGGR